MADIQKIDYYKNVPELAELDPRPSAAWSVEPPASATQSALLATHNRLGGLIGRLAQMAGLEVPAILAVFFVESGGRALTPGRALIRFECNLLFSAWGQKNDSAYRGYFRHGGFDGLGGKPWENHQFRIDSAQPFQPVHRNQESEYNALDLASKIAGENVALPCMSIGGCQILVSNYGMLGYGAPKAMYDAFQARESAHVLGFFDYCAQRGAPKKGDLIRYLQAGNWVEFARFYNGPGNAAEYGRRIGEACSLANELMNVSLSGT